MTERRRKRESKEVIFYISFSDMMSLLMAFFVLLFSMSTLDTVKFRQLTASINSIFDEKQKEKMLEEYEQEEQILKKLYAELTNYTTANHLEDQVSVRLDNHSIILDLGSKLLFPVAKADLLDGARTVLGAFNQYFKAVENANIVVEGHTDDIPIQTADYPSNWELSAARAASVVHFLAENGIKEENCYIIGYNQYKPLVPNDSEENRAKNRRVRIIFKPVVTKKLNLNQVNMNAIVNTDKNMEIITVTKNIDAVPRNGQVVQGKEGVLK